MLLGDCLELMAKIPDGTVDMILADLPYGTTSCRWDVIIPFEPLWAEYRRIIKPNGAIVLTASQPFTSALVMSNPDWFRYEWIWDKKNPTMFALANKQPLKYHENILVFYGKQPTYNPIKWQGKKNHGDQSAGQMNWSESRGAIRRVPTDIVSGMKFPRSIIEIEKHSSQCGLHPTQKPVALFEYLIRTYTNEGDLVLDNAAGSGTTAIAAINTKRRYLLIEKDEKYYEIAKKRIENHKPPSLTED